MNMADQLADEIYGLHCDIGRLENENALLREVVSDGELHAREILAENATLRRQLADVTESMGRVEARCAKLWELVRRYGEYTDQDRCEECVVKSRCNNGEVEECWQLTEIRELVRGLGAEVN